MLCNTSLTSGTRLSTTWPPVVATRALFPFSTLISWL